MSNITNVAVYEAAQVQLAQELQAGADARDYALLAGVISDLVERITGFNPKFPRVVSSALPSGVVIKARIEGTL
jgi:hypothetical protein